jgi:hypothetical protein
MAAYFGLRSVQKRKLKLSLYAIILASIFAVAGAYLAPHLADKFINGAPSQIEAPQTEHPSGE